MLSAIGRGDRRHHSERRRNRGYAQAAREPVLQRLDLLAHGARVADDAARPIEGALALVGEADEARTALHQHDAEGRLELLDAGGQRRLGDAAGVGGTAEMLFAGKRQKVFELVDHRGNGFFYWFGGEAAL